MNYVPNCKYLGLWIDSKLALNTHITKTLQKLQNSLYHFHYLNHTGIKLLPKTIIQIYKTKTRPIFEYASIFYIHNDKIDSIQKMQNKFLRFAYPCKLSTPIAVLEMIAKLEPVQIRYKKLILRPWARALYSSDIHTLRKSYESHKNILCSKRPLRHNKSPPLLSEIYCNMRFRYLSSTKTKSTITLYLFTNLQHIQIPLNYTVYTQPTTHNKPHIYPILCRWPSPKPEKVLMVGFPQTTIILLIYTKPLHIVIL